MSNASPGPVPTAVRAGRARRAWYRLRAVWRRVRVDRTVTRVLGPQYRRSRDAIEIDLTWACNLSCRNCNRSVRQAPTGERMTLPQVRAFVDESRASRVRWRRVRLLGGEPTLHPEFDAVVDLLDAARRDGLVGEIEVVTNGHGPTVRAALARVAGRVTVCDSRKEGDDQPDFDDFNGAPRDDRAWQRADWRNACWVVEGCGMGLGPYGYYPCAVAAGIDRVLGLGLGRAALPSPDDDMSDALASLCQWCGHFKSGHFVPAGVRPPLRSVPVSPSWVEAYARPRKRGRGLRRYAEP